MPQLALLVDHDADTRTMYAEYLRTQSFAIDEAEDGREALAKAIAYRPSVVVTETRLPGMSGLELCRLLRSDEPTRSIPLIVVTADAFPAQVQLAEIAGADVVLTKPCLPDDLGEQVRRLLATSGELRDHGRTLRSRGEEQRARSGELIDPAAASRVRVPLNRTHQPRVTSEPPVPPPSIVCPRCARAMRYLTSRIGGVSARHAEQWDYYECVPCAASYEYRQRTRKIRPSAPPPRPSTV